MAKKICKNCGFKILQPHNCRFWYHDMTVPKAMANNCKNPEPIQEVSGNSSQGYSGF